MDEVHGMKLVCMMIVVKIVVLVVALADDSPIPSPASPLPPPFDQHDLPLDQHPDFKIPKKLPNFHFPPRVLIIGFCIMECHNICKAGGTPVSHLYQACMLFHVAKKCHPSRLDVVSNCALGCISTTAMITSAYGMRFLIFLISLCLL